MSFLSIVTYSNIRTCTDLNAETADADEHLRQVAFLVQRLGGERVRLGHAVLLNELGEHGDPLALPHHAHAFNLRHLEGLVAPVNLAWCQLINESERKSTTTAVLNTCRNLMYRVDGGKNRLAR